MADPEVSGPARLGPVELRNRVIKAATFEGMTPHGLVTDELIEFHRVQQEHGQRAALTPGRFSLRPVRSVAVSETR